MGESLKSNPWIRDLPKTSLGSTAVKVASNPLLEKLESVWKVNQSDDPVEITARGVDKSPLRVTNNGLGAEGPS